jgi:hypothetical protein
MSKKNSAMMRFKLVFIALIFLVCACKDSIDRLLTFTISNTADFTIANASPVSLPIEIQTPDITTNSSHEFDNHKTRADLVKNVTIEEVKLSITNPSGKTFSFLKSIHIYISTNANDEIELAFLDDVVSTSATINLTTTTQKLDTYIKASSYKLRTKVVTKETLTQDVDVEMNLKFKVTANPI